MIGYNKEIPEILPLLPVSDSVIFPRMIVPLVIDSDDQRHLPEESMAKDKLFVVSLAKNSAEDEGESDDIYRIGTLVQILKLSRSDDNLMVVVQGIARMEITEMVSRSPYLTARVKVLDDIEQTGRDIDAMNANIMGLVNRIVEAMNLPRELADIARSIDQPGLLADIVASSIHLPKAGKQKILESLDIRERLEKLIEILSEQITLHEMGQQIQDKVKKGIDRTQREYHLREQLKAIQNELGTEEEENPDADGLPAKIAEKNLPEHARAAAEKEARRLERMHPSSAEYTVSQTYIEWILDLPWMEATEDNLDLEKAAQVLDRHHYNLEKVKRRILEYLAVRKLNPDHKGTILCFAGPPGTGKTSLGRSIAEAMGRRFVRVSLGGVKDEAEIRGHRRTYVGALPGRIIQQMARAGSNNPVFMLDEIDKLGNDFRGDPSSALLEVLDPEQNHSFSDHYLDLEFDLSGVIFLATANQLDTIPAPLRDRMEVLELSGYTEDEKLTIAQKFLVPRQIREHGLTSRNLTFRKTGLRKIVREQTREAGLRNLEREIGAVCRVVAKRVAGGETARTVVSTDNMRDFLGNPRYSMDLAERTAVPGVATGMAWTPAGGDILFVEATMMPGATSLVLTGQLGDIMKESAQAALSYLRTRAPSLGIEEDFYKNHDLHIHVPAGAIPKDGPSAGVTMLTALASLLTCRPVKPKLAMTGEVTLRGNVLPVGGIKDKLLAASRSGISQVIIPQGNRYDIDELPENVRKKMTVHLVDRMDEVLKLALESQKKASCS